MAGIEQFGLDKSKTVSIDTSWYYSVLLIQIGPVPSPVDSQFHDPARLLCLSRRKHSTLSRPARRLSVSRSSSLSFVK